MKLYWMAALAALICSLALPSEATAQRRAARVTATHAPAPSCVWVPPHRLADGTFVPGHWRAPALPGYVWVQARMTAGGRIVPGHWRPVRDRRGHVWVPGHVTQNGRHVLGHWRPVRDRPGHVWVPGHVDHRGRWVSGFWQPASRRAPAMRATTGTRPPSSVRTAAAPRRAPR